MNLDLNDFAQDVHALAVEKGFYAPPPSDAELIAAIHSEISEAFEEWRNNRPMVWRECLDGGDIGAINGDGRADCDNCACKPSIPGKPDVLCPMLDPEPHGIAVELIDVVLRVLDYIAGHGLEVVENDVDTFARDGCMVGADKLSMPRLVLSLHYGATVSFIHMEQGTDDCAECLNAILGAVFSWVSVNGIDPESLLREKHEYNQTRPYKHGGKRA